MDKRRHGQNRLEVDHAQKTLSARGRKLLALLSPRTLSWEWEARRKRRDQHLWTRSALAPDGAISGDTARARSHSAEAVTPRGSGRRADHPCARSRTRTGLRERWAAPVGRSRCP